MYRYSTSSVFFFQKLILNKFPSPLTSDHNNELTSDHRSPDKNENKNAFSKRDICTQLLPRTGVCQKSNIPSDFLPD